jgi:hypothetical protein
MNRTIRRMRHEKSLCVPLRRMRRFVAAFRQLSLRVRRFWADEAISLRLAFHVFAPAFCRPPLRREPPAAFCLWHLTRTLPTQYDEPASAGFQPC